MQEDTFLLWKDVVSNRLLSKVVIVLFMNKMDILQSKIGSGIEVTKYVPKFEGNTRSADEVARCMLGSTLFELMEAHRAA